MKELKRIIEQDPLAPLDEQDQLQVWSMRSVGYSLPCALTGVVLYVCCNLGMFVRKDFQIHCPNYSLQSHGTTAVM